MGPCWSQGKEGVEAGVGCVRSMCCSCPASEAFMVKRRAGIV